MEGNEEVTRIEHAAAGLRNRPTQFIHAKGKEEARLKLYKPRVAAPQGFEPRYAAPEAAVLPLNEGAPIVGRPVNIPAHPGVARARPAQQPTHSS